VKHIRNTEHHGLYKNPDGRIIKGPILHKVMPVLSLTEQYNHGMITLREYGIMGRTVETIEQMQKGKIK